MGSEMCIRDRTVPGQDAGRAAGRFGVPEERGRGGAGVLLLEPAAPPGRRRGGLTRAGRHGITLSTSDNLLQKSIYLFLPARLPGGATSLIVRLLLAFSASSAGIVEHFRLA